MKKKMCMFLCAFLIILTGCSPGGATDSSLTSDSSVILNESLISDDLDSSVISNQSLTDEDTDSTAKSQAVDTSTSTSLPESSTGMDLEESESDKNKYKDNNCKLIVKGKDITTQCYVHIDENNRGAEIPITAIAIELGAKVEWKDSSEVEIGYGERKISFDIAESHFGHVRMPGSKFYVRKVVGNEIVVDNETAQYRLSYLMNAMIEIDFDNRIITVQ